MKSRTAKGTVLTEGKSCSVREEQKILLTNGYQPPKTTKTRVETEGGICAASVVDPDKKDESIKATGHELGETFDFSSSNDDQWK